ncbi:MAG: nucleotidyl transferase AbiEii/AbiGii toxin family protein [Lewinellaceae bacterium]|nr:nucleotidyl transferase AbiEii/AbiGii toxin family protein [Lewinellaceae bacterium]
MDLMLVLSALPNKDQFEQAASELAIDPAVVEKDWHVTRVLALLANVHFPGFRIVFSGGTALSKAYGLIQRFSEDIDFLVIAADTSPNRKILSGFKNAVLLVLYESGFRIDHKSVKASDGNKFFSASINYDTYFDPYSSLRPHIQIEVKVLSPRLPVLHLPVQSFLGKLMQKPPEVEQIACIAPTESAADKLSALAWRVPNRQHRNEPNDRALVRHIHDLAAMESILETDIRFSELVIAVMHQDMNRAKNVPAFSALSNAEKFQMMLDILEQDEGYPQEYDKFVKSVSYAPAGTELAFAEAMYAVKRLVRIVLANS